MKRSFAVIGLLVLAAACGPSGDSAEESDAPAATPSITFRDDGSLNILRGDLTLSTLAIEIADTDESREKGMMERTSFPTGTGMLFLMPQEQIQQFWMGNTPLSLDLIFIDADSQVVDIAKEAQPYSPDLIISRVPALYVLEVPGGFSDVNGIVEGDRVRWIRH